MGGESCIDAWRLVRIALCGGASFIGGIGLLEHIADDDTW